MEGKIHSIQSLGTLDGPGLRFVIFFQGCNLRCGCCHNPDTWNLSEGSNISSQELINKAIRYKEYFNNKGISCIDVNSENKSDINFKNGI